jgi:succinate-semialdehyde dehydrogenase/glutarate-semialdehyde dehydrogenase
MSYFDDHYSTVPTDLYIGGKWVPARSGASVAVHDPSTGHQLSEVADAGVGDALDAVAAAAQSYSEWRAWPPRERSEILRSCWQLMTERADWLAELIALENGKAFPDAAGEVAYAAEFFRWYAEEAVRAPGELRVAPSGANKILVSHEPVGVSLLVTPWNFPAAMATRKIAPALAAGCPVVLKPAIETPLTALAIAAIAEEAGVPAGVLNVVTTSHASTVVAAILADARVRALSFTGSTEVGRILLRAAADNVVKCSMELGGNASFLVLDDAELDEAVAGAMVAKMRNGGQACTAANRFYVQSGIYDAFVDKLAARMGALRLGEGRARDTECGPLVNQDSLDKVQRLVGGAVSEGARAVLGGTVPDGPGFFYPPTVLADVPEDSVILRDEIFGPVAPVVRVDDVARMIRLANDTIFGLASYVYTGDLARGLDIAAQLQCGMVGLNRGLVSDPAAPFGGTKQSGLGREGSREGMLEFMEAKYIAASW